MKPTYEQLEQQVLELSVQLANAESKCRELAAESAGLKRVPASNSETMLLALDAFATHGCTRPDVGLQQAINVVMQRRQTPATDAFLAEVRDEVIEWLDAEISAIDPVYRGDPSYEHDAHWMKNEVRDLVESAKKVFACQQSQQEAAQ